METSTKILLGGLAAVGVLFVVHQRTTLAVLEAQRAAALPPPVPFKQLPAPVPISTNPVSRTEDPPSNSAVPPGNFIATFTGTLRLSNAMDEQNGTAIGPVPVGTLLAEVTIRTSDALRKPLDPSSSAGGSFPVSWVSPDGERIAFTAGQGTAALLGMPSGLLIAHKESLNDMVRGATSSNQGGTFIPINF